MVPSTSLNRTSTPKKPASGARFSRKSSRPNASILSFFPKTQKPEEPLFVGPPPARDAPASRDDDIYGDDDRRFNESESPAKKIRLDGDIDGRDAASKEEPAVKNGPRKQKPRPRSNMPFIIDSESEGEDEKDAVHSLGPPHTTGTSATPPPPDKPPKAEPVESLELETNGVATFKQQHSPEAPPADGPDGLDGAEDLQDFEGEEMRERRLMWEQARLEADEDGSQPGSDFGDGAPDDGDATMTECCPICNGSLAGVSADDATRHVNSCLDGTPIPLPAEATTTEATTTEATTAEATTAPAEVLDPDQISKRFARAAVPRPPQASPFTLEDGNGRKASSSSAFSRLMSGKAEDAAWTAAAAAAQASRGRRAHERTCPFYKIMPGFGICVDAFRYGAVEGCEAYFLSHFHSDHYVGLTAGWRHGPIYCSRVTGSLVRQQLRTAAKWVVELDFETPYEVPRTGATVTMIPANHCPGSSLFLFEKRLGGGVRRILHCGDFRACPGHVGHPLLRPDVVDSVTGRRRQQTIHVCYLDTTYLNPRYSFPPQDEVIRACADLCASLSPDPDGQDGVWERCAGGGGGTQTMSRYLLSGDGAGEGSSSSSSSSNTGTGTKKGARLGQRLLVVCGTYSIGKERICIAIAKALKTKIFATAAKLRICRQLDDGELAALLTSDPVEAQVHMQSLAEIRAETLRDYLAGYRPHFSRVVGFRPSGWTFRPGGGTGGGGGGGSRSAGAGAALPGSVPTEQLLHGPGWRPRFGRGDLAAQRGSTREAMCFGVPYSEHSSFRELAMFVMGLRIERVVPTVNVGSEPSRRRMGAWLDRWAAERRRGGLVRPLVEGEDGQDGEARLWDGKTAGGGGVWW